jgi:hypothetical protein
LRFIIRLYEEEVRIRDKVREKLKKNKDPKEKLNEVGRREDVILLASSLSKSFGFSGVTGDATPALSSDKNFTPPNGELSESSEFEDFSQTNNVSSSSSFLPSRFTPGREKNSLSIVNPMISQLDYSKYVSPSFIAAFIVPGKGYYDLTYDFYFILFFFFLKLIFINYIKLGLKMQM